MKRTKYTLLSICVVVIIMLVGIVSVSAISMEQETSSVIPFQINKSQLTFIESEKSQNENVDDIKQIDIFMDNQKNQFIYNQEGKQVGYIKNSNQQSKTRSASLPVDEIKIIANDTLNTLADIESYTLVDFIYEETSGSYILTYYRLINGYRSSDFIFITLSPTGDLLSYAAPNVHSFDGLSIPEINEGNYRQQLSSYLYEKYGSEMKEYSILGDPMIILNGNSLEFRLGYKITFQDGTQTADVHIFKLS